MLAVGPGGLDKDGKRIAPSVAPGDKVLIPQVRSILLGIYNLGRLIDGLHTVWRESSEGAR